MTYDRQILQILMDVGERGISVQSLAKHLYNLNCSFFSLTDYDEIRSYVQQYLLKNSKSYQSLIEHTERRGYYRLNTQHNADARQMVIQFREDQSQDNMQEEKSTVDYSLDLFV